MTTCKRCGDCCRYILLPAPDEINLDNIRMLQYRAIDIVTLDNGNRLFLKIPSICSQLDPENNLCMIHDNKPIRCKLVKCEKNRVKKLDFFMSQNTPTGHPTMIRDIVSK